MAITNLNDYLYRFFEANQCSILSNQNDILKVKLTEKMDRALMNRPFYWHYIKKIGQIGEPKTLTFITNPENKEEKGELIHFGSPRLQQIMNYLKENEKYVLLYEKATSVHTNIGLHPWLLVNLKITYIGRLQKDEIFSIGLNLINGMMKTQMMDYLKELSLQSNISDFCYTISPLIKLNSGFKRIEKVIQNYIENQVHDWAAESLKKSEDEINLLKRFYTQPNNEQKKQMEQEISEIRDRYHPTITLTVVNGGIVYLKQPVEK